jgi:hypothetical protein
MVVLRPTAPHGEQFRGPTASGQRQSEAIEIKGKLVETKLPIESVDFGRSDQFGVGNGNRVQGTIELLAPKFEKSLQLGEFRAEVILLPNVGLKQPGVIGATIEDMSRRQSVAGELTLEVFRGHKFLQIRLGE